MHAEDLWVRLATVGGRAVAAARTVVRLRLLEPWGIDLGSDK
jgi:hypothetical protein